MPLNRLTIQNIRNIVSAEIEPCSSINVISGDNGSGKTSFLEAISVLLNGRSFLTSNFRRFIGENLDQCLVFGVLDDGVSISEIGVQRDRNNTIKIKVNGESLPSAGQLASILPLQIINSDSFAILEGPAKVRRKLFDWLVFHVKHEFRETWFQYNQGLKQRNALIRRENTEYSDIEPWDLELSKLAEQLILMRNSCIEPLMLQFQGLMDIAEIGFKDRGIVACRYSHGWKPEQGSLAGQLKDNFQKDRALGYTTIGPHRSEFKLVLDKKGPVQEFLSRGQQKLIAAAFYLSGLKVLEGIGIKDLCLLVDDLPAELDQASTNVFCKWLTEIGCQSFISSIIVDSVLEALNTVGYKKEVAMFHVKHGEVKTDLFNSDTK